MKTLLRIDASIRHTGSYSRTMGDYFTIKWKEKNPGGTIIYRDVNSQSIPHLNNEVASAFFGRDRNTGVLKVSNELCDELKNCDELLITCPMYNLGIPSTLKAYFDHVVRVNETFQYSPTHGYQGLLGNKQGYIIYSMGGKRNTVVTAGFESYLENILAFIGIEEVRIISIDDTATKNFSEDWQVRFQTGINQLISE